MCAFDCLAFNAWLYAAFTNCIAFVRLTLVEALRVSHEDSASRRRRDTVVLKFLGSAGTAFPIDLNLQITTRSSAYLFPTLSNHCNRRNPSRHSPVEGDAYQFNRENSPEQCPTGWKNDWHATQEREVVERSVL